MLIAGTIEMKLLYKKHRQTPPTINKKIKMINNRYYADNANDNPSNPSITYSKRIFINKKVPKIQKSQKKPMRISKMLEKLEDLTKLLEEAFSGGN